MPIPPSAPDEVRERAARIALVVFDVDGVLTDGRLYFGDDGVEHKAFHVRDGHGIRMLRESGVEVAVITGRRSEIVAARMRELDVEHVVQGAHDKLAELETLLSRLGIEANECACVGDDVQDLPVMTRCGLAVAVADAHPEVLARADWRTPSKGGRGAAREVCDLVMAARGTLDAALARWLDSAGR